MSGLGYEHFYPGGNRFRPLKRQSMADLIITMPTGLRQTRAEPMSGLPGNNTISLPMHDERRQIQSRKLSRKIALLQIVQSRG